MGFLVNSFISFGAFSPADLFTGGEDGAWYDPSDISTLWQDTAGTSAVTASGQSVARIDDKSGNGRHLTQSTASARPTYIESGGLKYLDFDGGDSLVSLSGTAILNGGGAMAVAAASDDAEAIQGIMNEKGASGQAPLFLDTRASPRRVFNYAVDATNRLIDYDAEQSGSEIVAMFSHDGSTGTAYRNNVAQGSSVTTTANFSGSTTLYLGVELSLFLNGKIYGAVIVDRGLTSTERGSLNTWLAAKAGI